MNTTHLPNGTPTHSHLIERTLLPFLSQLLTAFQNLLTPLIQRFHSTASHLIRALPTIAQSDTPTHYLRLHTTASLSTLTYPFMSHEDHIMAHMHSIAVATPPHHLIPDLPNTLATLTQHFTSRFLHGIHTILHVSINETYAQLAHSFATLNAYFLSGISNQIHPDPPLTTTPWSPHIKQG